MPASDHEGSNQANFLSAIKQNLPLDKLVESKAQDELAWASVNIVDILHIAGLFPPFSPRWKEKGASQSTWR